MTATLQAWRERFPAEMMAACALGHQWPVSVTWWPKVKRADGTWDADDLAPSPSPARCGQCGLRIATLTHLEDVPTTPAPTTPASAGRIT